VRLCETVHCRRATLLATFGDTLTEPCGNCDSCLKHIDVVDGTVAAQKLLSCIGRTGERYGGKHVIDVVLGNATERVVKLAHDKLPTFGSGREWALREWGSALRQLIVQSLVAVKSGEYAVLELNDASRAVLRGERKVELRRALAARRTWRFTRWAKRGARRTSRVQLLVGPPETGAALRESARNTNAINSRHSHCPNAW
jgi:ATP-dependent DNA helicase RecQ